VATGAGPSGAAGARGRPGREPAGPIGAALRAADGPVDLGALDPAATPGLDGGRAVAEEEAPSLRARLAELQEMLFAHGRAGGTRRLLLVLQGMDTAGKGGTVRHVVGAMDPQGVRVTAFGPPTDEERREHFLRRVRRRLPDAGMVGVFDRSHYEDVVAARVRRLAPRAAWEARFAEIVEFERALEAGGTRVVKCLLHISPEESRERLLARLDDPRKHWKYDPSDVDARARWGDYRRAYADALARCGADAGAPPWHVVPADRKWYRNWAVGRLLVEELEALGLGWPAARVDVAAERRRLLAAP